MKLYISLIVVVGVVCFGVFFWLSEKRSDIHLERSYERQMESEISKNLEKTVETEKEAQPKNEDVKTEPEHNTLSKTNTTNSNKTNTENVPIDSGVSRQKNDGKESENKEKISSLPMEKRLVSWGFQKSSGRSIDSIILHSTYNALGGDKYGIGEILDIYKSYGVSPHYIIDRKGMIYHLVQEKDIAYHAGVATLPNGKVNVNESSIGIELVGDTKSGFSREQYDSVNALIQDIKDRYAIQYVLGHNEIAPERKTDPWKIEWKKINR